MSLNNSNLQRQRSEYTFAYSRSRAGLSQFFKFLQRHFGSRSQGLDLSFSRWRQCYKSRGSYLVYLASEVQKRSNAPVLGQTLATKASKSRAISPYVPGVNSPGWPLINALHLWEIIDVV